MNYLAKLFFLQKNILNDRFSDKYDTLVHPAKTGKRKISPKQSLCSDCLEVVNMGVLTEDLIYFICLISQLMAIAIPVRGARF